MTPIRRQYLKIKHSYPDAIVLFRLGDFYETFDDDAHLASAELEITLTSRSMGKNLKVPMAGVPAHSLDSYLARLIKRGHKVAICEQLTDPAKSRGIVERDVVRVVTPGTVVETGLLEHNANNYLSAVVEEKGGAGFGLRGRHHRRVLRRATGSLRPSPWSWNGLLPPRSWPQTMMATAAPKFPPEGWRANPRFTVTPLGPASFRLESCRDRLLEHYGAITLESFGCDNLPLAGAGRRGRHRVPVADPQGIPAPPVPAERLLHGRVHGAGRPDPPEPGTLPGGKGPHGGALASVRSGPHPHRDGRTPATPLAGTTPAGPG